MRRNRESNQLAPTTLFFLSKGQEGYIENRFVLFELLYPAYSDRKAVEDLQAAYLESLSPEERARWESLPPVDVE